MIVRKTNPSSLRKLITGEEAEGEMKGTCSSGAIVSPSTESSWLVSGPTKACTPSCSTNRRASCAAVSSSPPVSAAISSTGRPKTPPAALMCWMARVAPCSVAAPRAPNGPE